MDQLSAGLFCILPCQHSKCAGTVCSHASRRAEQDLARAALTCQALCDTTAASLGLGGSLGKCHSGWLLAGTVAGQSLKDGLRYSLGIGLRDTCTAEQHTR